MEGCSRALLLITVQGRNPSCIDKFCSRWSGSVSWFLSECPVPLDAGTATQEGARWDSLMSMRARFSRDSELCDRCCHTLPMRSMSVSSLKESRLRAMDLFWDHSTLTIGDNSFAVSLLRYWRQYHIVDVPFPGLLTRQYGRATKMKHACNDSRR